MIGRFLQDMTKGPARVMNPVPLPPMKTVWVVGLASGVAFWIVGLALWSQGTLDEAVLFSFGLSGIAGDLLKMVFARPRPSAVFGDRIVALSEATSQALPSGHATKTMALALPFLFLVSNKSVGHRTLKGVVALLAVGVAFGRIILGAHYLSDVLAGIGTAFLGLPFSMLVAHAVLRRMDESQLPKLALRWAVILVGLTVAFWFL